MILSNKSNFFKLAFIKQLQAIGIRPKLDMEHKRWRVRESTLSL